MRGVVERLAPFLRVPAGPSRLFLVISLIDSFGTGLFLALYVVYFTVEVGLGASVVALGLGAGAVVSLCAMLPTGLFADRLGAKPVLIGLQVWRAVCYLALAFVDTATAFVVLSALLGLADRGTGPLNQTVASAGLTGDGRMALMASIRSVRNIGFAAGAGLGVVLTWLDDEAGYRTAIVANGVSFLVVAALLLTVPGGRATSGGPAAGWAARLRVLGTDRRYLLLALANAVLVVHVSLLSFGLPLWIVSKTAAPAWTVGAMIALNTVLAILLQVPASRGCESPAVAARRSLWAAVAIAACCLVAAAGAGRSTAVAVAAVVIAVVLLTVGELWQSAASWGLSYELAPAADRSAYLSAFGLGAAVQSAAAPAALVWIVAHDTSGWLALAAVVLAAGVAVTVIVRPAEALEAAEVAR